MKVEVTNLVGQEPAIFECDNYHIGDNGVLYLEDKNGERRKAFSPNVWATVTVIEV